MKNIEKYGIMNAKAFIIHDLNALADAQIKDLLPAIGRLYHNASLIWYNGNNTINEIRRSLCELQYAMMKNAS